MNRSRLPASSFCRGQPHARVYLKQGHTAVDAVIALPDARTARFPEAALA
jgi:hypothetical protein